MTVARPRDVQVFGDTIRLRHRTHFAECHATGRWSGIFFDYLYRDLEPHLLEAVRRLEERARRQFRGSRLVEVLNALYERRDKQPEQLVTVFLSCGSATSPEQLGFGYIGEGLMGITEPLRFAKHLREFQDRIWSEVLASAG